jgi:hypothetical protein
MFLESNPDNADNDDDQANAPFHINRIPSLVASLFTAPSPYG